MRQINLLPSDLKPGKKVKLAVKRGEKYFISVVIIYLILLSGSVFYIFRLDKTQKSLVAEKNSLSSEVKSLSNVETSTVYIRDRVDKYTTITDKDIELNNLDRFERLSSQLLPSIELSDAKISDNEATFSVVAVNTFSLTYFVNKIIEMDLYKNIYLSDISYTKGKGYIFNVSINF